jgi:tetratricopeptide (TPR) repeat protein
MKAQEEPTNRRLAMLKSEVTRSLLPGMIFLLLLTVSTVNAQNSRVASADSYLERGNAWYKMGELEKAIGDFNLAIIFDPRSASAFYNRGNVHRDRRDWEGALADYTRAIEISPRLEEAYSNRGNIRFKKQGDLEGDSADYTNKIEIEPTHAEYYNKRVGVL